MKETVFLVELACAKAHAVGGRAGDALWGAAAMSSNSRTATAIAAARSPKQPLLLYFAT